VADLGSSVLDGFLARYGVVAEWVTDGEPIRGSYWGAPEAGIVGRRIFLRGDTPVHSMLHELCHVVCMDDARRDALDRDAGGDDLEEAAVCYLQVVLADYLEDVGRERLMHDMDAWGYSFRLGSASRWFEEDAKDARRWLEDHGLMSACGKPVFRLRQA